MDLIDAFNNSGIFAKLTLLVAFGPLLLAALYIFRPAEATLAVMRPVSLAAVFAGLCGVAAGLIAVLLGIGATSKAEIPNHNVFIGLAEALVPAFVNFGSLTAGWLLVAVGMLRRARE